MEAPFSTVILEGVGKREGEWIVSSSDAICEVEPESITHSPLPLWGEMLLMAETGSKLSQLVALLGRCGGATTLLYACVGVDDGHGPWRPAVEGGMPGTAPCLGLAGPW